MRYAQQCAHACDWCTKRYLQYYDDDEKDAMLSQSPLQLHSFMLSLSLVLYFIKRRPPTLVFPAVCNHRTTHFLAPFIKLVRIQQSILEMSALSEDVEIYEHKYYIRRIIVHPDGERCITVSLTQVKMFSLHSHEHLMDFEISDSSIQDAALFDNETLMAYTVNDGIVFWSLSNGAISLRDSKRETKDSFYSPTRIFPLRPNQFMVIGNAKEPEDTGNAIAYMLKKQSRRFFKAGSITLRVLSTRTFPAFNDVCSHGNRFVVSIRGNTTVQVWELESDEFQRIKVWDVGFVGSRVALSDKYVMCADGGKTIRIYESSTTEFIRELTSPLPISRLVTTWGDYLVVTSGEYERTVALLDIEGGEILWKKDFEFRIEECHLSVSKEIGAQLIVGQWIGRVLQCSLPSDIGSKLLESDSSALCVLPSLQKALSRCLAGEASPTEYCNSLITFSACSVSFPEWCSAHQLLILAVRNGEISKSTEHNDSIAHWFENLYLAVKDLDMTSDEDLVVAKRYLREAKRMGLIETIESVLAALHVTSQVREEVRTLHRAGILIFEQVMRIEKRLDMLKQSCEQYRKHQMYSQCIGIALQIIPIVGGASAGVISAGANIVEGLSIKDVADYAFGLGSSLTEGEMSSLGDRIFGRAAEVLSPESVAKMKDEELRLVEEAVCACGLNVEELRLLFIERSQDDSESNTVDEGELKEGQKERCEEPEIYPALQKTTSRGPTTSAAEDHIPEKGNCEGIANKKPSELKIFELDSAVVQGLDKSEIAALWAAFIFGFQDRSLNAFVALRDRIWLVLEANNLDGAVLVDREETSSSELAKTIVDGLNNDGHGEVTVGVRVKVKHFINAISD